MKTKIILNEDADVVKEVRQALKDNNGYCPCKLLQIPDNVCMCKEFRNQESGFCACKLYQKILEEEKING